MKLIAEGRICQNDKFSLGVYSEFDPSRPKKFGAFLQILGQNPTLV